MKEAILYAIQSRKCKNCNPSKGMFRERNLNETSAYLLASTGKKSKDMSISLFCLETNVKSEILTLIMTSCARYQSFILFR